MQRKKQDATNCAHADGNGGGDYFVIRPTPDGRVFIEIGHCCVVYVRHIVPVEMLTSTLAEAWSDGPTEHLFGEEYHSQLMSKVEKEQLF